MNQFTSDEIREALHNLAANSAYYMSTGMGREVLKASIDRAWEVQPWTTDDTMKKLNEANLLKRRAMPTD